jgi:DNA-binding transcriptional ArsR family regulator
MSATMAELAINPSRTVSCSTMVQPRSSAPHLICNEPNMSTMQEAIEAIAHPGRRAILRLVLDRELGVSELAERIGVSQPAASQHLKVLREAGLVRGRVDGRRRLYRVDAEGLERLRRELDAYWGPALTALKDAAETP